MILKDREGGNTYNVMEELGRGTYGRCFLVVDMNTNQKLACKQIRNIEEFYEESTLHRQLQHKHVIQFFKSFELDGKGYITMELCSNGNLADLLKRRKVLNNIEVRSIICHVANGLQYLHSNYIVHRDIKLLNLLIADSMDVKIADFGLAKKLQSKDDKRRSFCGTNYYVSPEVINGWGHSFPADIWAIGCVFYTLLVGKEPFRGCSVSDTHRKITSINFPKSSKLSPLALSLLKTVFVQDACQRPTALTILNHPYFRRKLILPKLPQEIFDDPYMPRKMNAHLKRGPCRDITNLQENGNYIKKPTSENVYKDKENFVSNGTNVTEHKMTLRPRKQNVNYTAHYEPDIKYAERKIDAKEVLAPYFSNVEYTLSTIKKLFDGQQANITLEVSTIDASFVCITRWITTENRRGLAYHLSDGSFSFRFGKNAHYHRTKSGRITIFIPSSKPVTFTKDSLPTEYSETVQWVESVRNHMLQLRNTGPCTPYTKMTLVKKWKYYSKEKIIAFYLSNGSCQVNFDTHEKILLNAEENILVSWIDSDWIVMPLNSINNNFRIPPQIGRKIAAIERFLTDILKSSCVEPIS